MSVMNRLPIISVHGANCHDVTSLPLSTRRLPDIRQYTIKHESLVLLII
jgi:hypothetical protein